LYHGLDIYLIPSDIDEMKSRIRREFRNYSQVNEIKLIDALVIRAYMDYEEILLHHKQAPHLLGFFTGGSSPIHNKQISKQSKLKGQETYKRITKETVDISKLTRSMNQKGMGGVMSKILESNKDF
jgi:hypothetical protein